ncbi:MAG: AtpZ/AtpI family protein [Myxococcales bacterium]|nr:MAG: AtpZ/AtpI family protein [Myxococcales bacterium]
MPLIDPEGREQLKVAARVSIVGLELVLAMVVGYLVGRWLDNHFGTNPYLKITGLVLGCITGFRALYRLAKTVDLDKM